jgi:hypothetical protein
MLIAAKLLDRSFMALLPFVERCTLSMRDRLPLPVLAMAQFPLGAMQFIDRALVDESAIPCPVEDHLVEIPQHVSAHDVEFRSIDDHRLVGAQPSLKLAGVQHLLTYGRAPLQHPRRKTRVLILLRSAHPTWPGDPRQSGELCNEQARLRHWQQPHQLYGLRTQCLEDHIFACTKIP